MEFRIDPDSPVPLYHQIAEAIRYRISTGAVRAGQSLPTLRDAAARWSVNLHTVRRAYAQLAAMGLVRIRRPAGAIVLEPGGSSGRRPARSDKLQRFVTRVLDQAKQQHGLSPLDLARLLTVRPAGGASKHVVVVECSETQCADLAGQLEQRWELTAEPWCLSRPGDLPDGDVVATYFHYNDIRRRWPRRLAGIHFVAIQPDAAIPARIDSLCRRGRPRELLVCERDPMMLSMITADLTNLFRSRRYKLTSVIEKDCGSLLVRRNTRLHLVSPRVWGGLTAEQRTDPRVIEIRYVFDSLQIEGLAAELDWPSRPVKQEALA